MSRNIYHPLNDLIMLGEGDFHESNKHTVKIQFEISEKELKKIWKGKRVRLSKIIIDEAVHTKWERENTIIPFIKIIPTEKASNNLHTNHPDTGHLSLFPNQSNH